MSVQKYQIKIIQTLISKANLRDEKDALVLAYTNNRTKSSKEMKYQEAQGLIDHLNNATGNTPSPQNAEREIAKAREQKMKKKIFAMCHEMAWYVEGTRKIDIDRLNNWCLKYGIYVKPLDKHTYEELPVLVTQFEKVYKSYLEGLN